MFVPSTREPQTESYLKKALAKRQVLMCIPRWRRDRDGT